MARAKCIALDDGGIDVGFTVGSVYSGLIDEDGDFKCTAGALDGEFLLLANDLDECEFELLEDEPTSSNE